jgi:hypothetical protein
MGHANWDAALVIRANELLEEVRRYHADAEATRLQLASTATLIARKVDELPHTVRRLVEESLHQDTLNAERPIIAKRLDSSSRLLNEVATQLHESGSRFLKYARIASATILLLSGLSGIAMIAWIASTSSEAVRLSTEVSTLRRTVSQLEEAGGRAVVRPCIDSALRPRTCIRIDESAGKTKDAYYMIAR